MTSRLNLARDAVRPALKARAMLSGPPGSGKTRSGLIIATELAGRDYMDDGETRAVLVIDTERESALTYAEDFLFKHLAWEPPYSPRELADTIIDAGRHHDVVMIDSGSHFWRGEGGTLDIADGNYTGWKDARPAQNDMVTALLRCEAHVIFCCRAKMAHEQVRVGDKWVVNKLGIQPIQDDDLEYELNVSLDVAMDHSLTLAKSRTTHLPTGTVYTSGHAAKFAVAYREWLAGGEPPAHRSIVEDLRARVAALPDGIRGDCKADYLATLGRPANLTEAQAPMAEELVARYEARAAEAGTGAQDAQDAAEGDQGTDTSPAPVEDAQADEAPASAADEDDGAESTGDNPEGGVTCADPDLSATDVADAIADTLREVYGKTGKDLQAEARESRLALGGGVHQLARRIAQHRLVAVGIHTTQGALADRAHELGLGTDEGGA